MKRRTSIVGIVEGAIASMDVFTVDDVAAAARLPERHVLYALQRLGKAGSVHVVGEKPRTTPGSGRGARVYARTAEPAGEFAARIRKVVLAMNDRFDFTAADVVKAVGCPEYLKSSVLRLLPAFERQGDIHRIVEERPREGGRPPARWTANPENIEVQKGLAVLVARIDEEEAERGQYAAEKLDDARRQGLLPPDAEFDDKF